MMTSQARGSVAAVFLLSLTCGGPLGCKSASDLFAKQQGICTQTAREQSMGNAEADPRREAQLVAAEEKCKGAQRGVSEQYGVWRSSAWNALSTLLAKYPHQAEGIKRGLRGVALDPALDPLHIPACWPLKSDDAWTDTRATRRFMKDQESALASLRAVEGELVRVTAARDGLPDRGEDLAALSAAISDYPTLIASEAAYDREVAAFNGLFKKGCETMVYPESGKKFSKRAVLQGQ